MILKKYKKNLFKYMTYIIILLITLYFLKKILINKFQINSISSEISIIENNNKNTNIYVEYPKFNNDIDSIIKNYIYNYIKDFKKYSGKKSLNINYETYKFDNYINIVFYINNTESKIKKSNILIDLNTNSITYITNIYDKEYISNIINNKVYYKYSNEIYNKIVNSNINNYTYIISDTKIIVYFNNIDLSNINYIPYIEIVLNENVSSKEDKYNGNKYIAFTYDDGPGEYSNELLKILELNNSSATFFMIGNRMNKYKETVINISNSNSEIGSHTYSHKNLTKISYNEIDNELNKTNEIFNNITGSNLKYLRPPYDYYNDYIINKEYTIITWNIDPKDWLYKDSNKIYNNVIKNVCDGCIVVMHDIYIETLEATKMLIPVLNEMGYNVVSISKLIEIKKYNIENHKVINSIK